MSTPDAAPDRKIGGLAPRPRFDATNLIKGQRTEQAPAKAASAAPKQPATASRTAPARVAPKAKQPSKAASGGEQTPMTVYIPKGLRARARAAYRGTSHLEDDRSFSHMIEKMLEAGLQDRELRHNDGKPFAGGTDQLSAGRPLSGD